MKYLKFDEVYKIFRKATGQKLLLVDANRQEIVEFLEVAGGKQFYLVYATDKTGILWDYSSNFSFTLNEDAIFLQKFDRVMKIRIYAQCQGTNNFGFFIG